MYPTETKQTNWRKRGMYIGKNITELRKQHNLTQEQLAEKCGVSRQAVTKWESGESEPNIERLVVLADVFQVSVDEIIMGTDTKEKSNILFDNFDVDRLFDSIETTVVLLGLGDVHSHRDIDEDIKYNARVLLHLYRIASRRYIARPFDDVVQLDEQKNEQIYEKYLVKNTTSKERYDISLALSGYGNFNFEDIWNDYIDGKCEISEVFDRSMDAIEKKIELINNKCEQKRESPFLNQYLKLKGTISSLRNWSDYSTTKQQKIIADVHKTISNLEFEKGTLSGYIMEHFAKEILMAYEYEDEKKAKELAQDMETMEIYIRSKIPVNVSE